MKCVWLGAWCTACDEASVGEDIVFFCIGGLRGCGGAVPVHKSTLYV
jgi:hypothetical protein